MNYKAFCYLLLTFSLASASPRPQNQANIPGYSLNEPATPLRPTVPPPPAPPTTAAVGQLYGAPETAADTPDQVVRDPPSTASAGPPAPPPQQPMQGMPYEFDWQVNDIESGNVFSHVESSDGAVAQGEYRVLLPDGRLQIVTFFDRGNGFEAEVTYQDYQSL